MSGRDSHYDILFEQVQIGPVTARNRFYQVPHCNGMGYLRPNTLAAMRGVKAEGGWAVVCTEEVEIHANSDNGSAVEGRLWDDGDIPALAKMAEAVHEHGALAGIELVHGGYSNANHYSRIPPIAPSLTSVNSYDPVQARAMTKADIRDFRRWHRQAAVRSRQAGFDLVYVYAGHNLTLLMHFLSRRCNQRTDEYGGGFEGRIRLALEVATAVREHWPSTKPLFYRLSVVDGEDGGWSVADSVALAKRLYECGVDVIDCSSGGITVPATANMTPRSMTVSQIQYAAEVCPAIEPLGMTTMAVGQITEAVQAEKIIESGKANLVAIGREMLFNPNWALHAAVELGVDPEYGQWPKQYGSWLQRRVLLDLDQRS